MGWRASRYIGRCVPASPVFGAVSSLCLRVRAYAGRFDLQGLQFRPRRLDCTRAVGMEEGVVLQDFHEVLQGESSWFWRPSRHDMRSLDDRHWTRDGSSVPHPQVVLINYTDLLDTLKYTCNARV